MDLKKEMAYVTVLRRFRRNLIASILDSIIAVAVITIFAILAPYLVSVAFGGSLSAMQGALLQACLTLIILYVSITRIGFALWSLFKIIFITARLPTGAYSEEEVEENKDAINFESLLESEYHMARRMISLVTVGIIILLVPTIPFFQQSIKGLEIPFFFKENPFLLVAPVSLVVFFLVLYNIPVFSMIENNLNNYYKIVLSLKIGLESLPATCPACGTSIPAEAIHCPYCGAKISREQKKE